MSRVVAGAAGLDEAAALLRAGALVAFPTETVYGLGADARNDAAVAAIFAAKERPRFNPLIIHVAEAAAARRLAAFPPLAERLALEFWPGPLTLVLPRRPDSGLSLLATAGLETVALRVPAHPLALALLERFGGPIAAPSANRSGEVSPTAPAHVVASLGARVPLVLAGGRCRVGLESTVVDLTGARPALLRAGGLERGALEAAIGPLDLATEAGEGAAPRSPGQLLRHYAPRVPLRLEAPDAGEGEALLAFGPGVFLGRRAVTVLNLSEGGDLTEAAANLFAHLRALDQPQHKAIAVMPIPDTGLGEAINDRLRRAARG